MIPPLLVTLRTVADCATTSVDLDVVHIGWVARSCGCVMSPWVACRNGRIIFADRDRRRHIPHLVSRFDLHVGDLVPLPRSRPVLMRSLVGALGS